MKKSSILQKIKFNIDEYHIKLYAYDSTAYVRGIELFQDGKIHNVVIGKTFDSESLENLYVIKAQVGRDLESSENVSIRIDMKGDIKLYSCTCPYFRSKVSYCKHLAALLLFILDQRNEYTIGDSKDSLAVENEGNRYLDTHMLRLIDYFEKSYDDLDIIATDSEKKYVVYPKLNFDNKNKLEFSISIDCGKKYVVKNIFEFCYCVKNSLDFSYGNSKKINHNIENFNEDSKIFLQFLINLCDDYIEKYEYASDILPNKKSIRIPSNWFEMMFNIFDGKSIEIQYPDNKLADIEFEYGDPQVEFEVDFNEETKNFELDILNIGEGYTKIFSLYNSLYVISNDKFFKCSAEFEEIMAGVLEEFKRNDYESISIHNTYITNFYSTVLGNIKEVCPVHIPEKLIEGINFYDLVAKVYLDINRSKYLEAKIDFVYGDQKFNPLIDKNNYPKNVARDIAKEKFILKLFKEYRFTSRKQTFIIKSDEDIYNFYKYGLNEVIKVSEVHITERFKKQKIKNISNTSMGVKINNNFLDINFENLNFDLNELKDIMKSYRLKKKFFRLKDGSYLNMEDSYFDSFTNYVDELDIENADLSEDIISLPKYKAIQLMNLEENEQFLQVKKDNTYTSIIEKLTELKENEYTPKDEFLSILRDYQKSGYIWLKNIAYFGLGGILADDMGLGKTLQVIALLADDVEKERTSIVVCPTSLIYNWINEIKKFYPQLKTVAIAGIKKNRVDLINDIDKYDVCITSYDSLKRDVDLYEQYEFNYCILDEAQYIKNSYTQNATSVKNIKASCRFALTGTPIENSLADLWSIFDFILPGYFSSYNSFKTMYENPITKDKDQYALEKLNKQIEIFVLRRLKTEVLEELPEKMETPVYTKMADIQNELYYAELLKANKQYSEEVSNSNSNSFKILSMLMRLRQICCHPSLFIENYDGKSAKLELCMELVRDIITNRHKVLIFSQFTSMLDIIGASLTEENIKYYVLTGKTKASERIEMIDKFNNDEIPVFLISLKAGGTGLNLIGADHVIHYDPWWNNSAQNQATDRAHRIGQKNKVQVYKLITQGTVEEKIEELQHKKQSLVDSVITEKEVSINSLTKEELGSLFEV